MSKIIQDTTAYKKRKFDNNMAKCYVLMSFVYQFYLSKVLEYKKLKGYSLDPHPQANVASRHFAVVFSSRKKRDRFPSSSVTVCGSKEEAITQQDHNKKLYAAEVMGPSKSSEGFKIFYLIEWLD